MSQHIILASGSATRAQLLTNAAVPFEVVIPRIDEAAIRDSMRAESAPPRDIADTLAAAKAARIAAKHPEALVIGTDQVLAHDDALLSKPQSPQEALQQLRQLRGKTHHLYSAVVIHADGAPIWRHIGHVRMQMHDLSDAWLESYVTRNWESLRHAVGGYKVEEEGIRLFSRIEGDYFSVLGLPLIELLSYLARRGALPS